MADPDVAHNSDPRFGRPRTRICKRCKFASSDAKEFLHHQMSAHTEADTHHCDKCEFVAESYIDLVRHKRIHRKITMDLRKGSTDSDTGAADETNNNERMLKNDHERLSTSDFNSDSAAEDDVIRMLPTRTYSCKQCQLVTNSAKTYLRHQIVDHNENFDVYECDLCEYATRYKQKLSRHRRCHFTPSPSPVPAPGALKTELQARVKGEIVNKDIVRTNKVNEKVDSICEKNTAAETYSGEIPDTNQELVSQGTDNTTDDRNNQAYITEDHRNYGNALQNGVTENEIEELAVDAAGSQEHTVSRSNSESHLEKLKHAFENQQAGDKLLEKMDYLNVALVDDSSKAGVHIDRDFQNHSKEKISLSKDLETAVKPTAGTTSASLRPKGCTPIREAVDPAKYITLHEVDGIKYACSKCGNVYKWRKSLNKHWKEKHDGEIPEPRSNQTPLVVPRVRGSGDRYLASHASSNTSTTPGGAVSQHRYSHYQSNISNVRSGFDQSFKSPSNKNLTPPRSTSTRYMEQYHQQMQSHNQNNWQSHHAANREYKRAIKQESPGLRYTIHKQGSPVDLSKYGSPAHTTGQRCFDMGAPPVGSFPLDLSKGAKPVMCDKSPQGPEVVLDLSKKGSSPVKHGHRVTPPQDEPIDFSQKVKGDATIQMSTPGDEYHIPNGVTPPPSRIDEYSLAMSLQCQSCAFLANSKQEYDDHLEVHARQRIYKCAECQESFHTLADLNEHFRICHVEILHATLAHAGAGGGLPKAKYSNPLVSIRESSQLYKYLTMDPSKQLLTCVVCAAVYQWQWTLSKHFDQDHPALPNPYRKRDHGKSPAAAAAEPGEKRTKISDTDSSVSRSNTPLACNQCAYSTSRPSDLARHQLKHSIKMYSCRLCGYSFKWKDLQSHHERFHPSVEMQPSDITVLDNELSPRSPAQKEEALTPPPENESLLSLEESAVLDLTAEDTAVVIPEAPEDTLGMMSNKQSGTSSAEILLPYKCSVCEYRARWPSEITQHMKNHSDEKPFLCPRCSYRSKWKWDVVKHLKRCGGGTVKDVIDTTKLKKQEEAKSIIAEALKIDKNTAGGRGIMASSGRETLSRGPPNVTVVASVQASKDEDFEGREELDQLMTAEFGETDDGFGAGSETSSHGQQYQLHCLQCPFVGSSPAELRRHTRVHSDEKPFICKTCGYCSKWKCDLKKHIRTYNHTPAVPLTYGGHGRKPADWYDNQPLADDRASRSPFSEKHGFFETDSETDGSENKFQTVDSMEQCDKCDFTTYKKSLLYSHMAIHGTSGSSGKFQCKKCSFEADELPDFVHHKRYNCSQSNVENGSKRRLAWGQDNSGVSDAESTDEMTPNKRRRKQLKQFITKNVSLELESSDSDTADIRMRETQDGDLQSTALNECTPLEVKRKRVPAILQEESKKGQTYKCSSCPYYTDNRTTFEKHVLMHNTPNRYQCEWCTWSADRLNLLYRHAQSVHPQEVAMEEKQAFFGKAKVRSESESSPLNKEKKTESGMQMSYWDFYGAAKADPRPTMEYLGLMPSAGSEADDTDGSTVLGKIKRKRKQKFCGKCNYVTDNVTTLQRHIAKHGGSGKYQCEICDYRVDKHHVVEYHMRQVHGAPSANGREPDGKKIETMKSEDEAPGLVIKEKDNREIVEDESAVAASDNDVTHEPEDAEFVENPQASVGGEKLQAIEKVRGQNMLVTREAGRTSYGCIKCTFSTPNITNVVNHIKQHGVKKKYTCEYCDYSLDQLRHVLHHMKTFHPDESDNTAMDCEYPDGLDWMEDFDGIERRRSSYRRSKSKPGRAKLVTYSCWKCRFITASKVHLRHHIIKHIGKPSKHLNCSDCSYRTTTAHLLKRHNRKQHPKSSKQKKGREDCLEHSDSISKQSERCPGSLSPVDENRNKMIMKINCKENIVKSVTGLF